MLKIIGYTLAVLWAMKRIIHFYGGPLNLKDPNTGRSEYSGCGFKIILENLIFKKTGASHFLLRSIAPDGKISIYPAAMTAHGKIQIDIININPARAVISGISTSRITRTVKKIRLAIELSGRAAIEINIRQEMENPFIYVYGDSQNVESPYSGGGYFVFQRILQAARKENPLFILSVGDLQPSGRYYHYRRLSALLSKIGKTPFYSAPGNHDTEPRNELWEKVLGPRYYSFDIQDHHFALIDNSAGFLEEEQMAWLENDLSVNCKRGMFLFFHKPLFDPRPDRDYIMENVKQRELLMSLIRKYRPLAVFSGHIHSYFHKKIGETDYFISGGGGGRLKKNGFFHYIRISLGKNKKPAYETLRLSSIPTKRFIADFLINILFLFITGRYTIFRKK